MEKTEREVIEELIVDHMNIIKGLVSMIDPEVNYMTMCWIEKCNDNEKDYYSFDSTNPNEERIINFNEFI